MSSGMEYLESNRPVEARRMLTRALNTEALDLANERRLRATLTDLNDKLVFSPEVLSGDPFAEWYVLEPGDQLSRIPGKTDLAIEWRFLQRINRILDPRRIRAGQRIKLVTGPFHLVIRKAHYRADLYLGDGPQRVYVRSFRVGLGEYNSTPVGAFRVKPDSKLINPEWVNPRTGQRYEPNDPSNPIGERWIGLVGVSETVKDLIGYGIHGTIEPESIGHQTSMGCIRMLPDDVAIVYELLVEDASLIEIRDR
jgi:hypothetical protein